MEWEFTQYIVYTIIISIFLCIGIIVGFFCSTDNKKYDSQKDEVVFAPTIGAGLCTILVSAFLTFEICIGVRCYKKVAELENCSYVVRKGISPSYEYTVVDGDTISGARLYKIQRPDEDGDTVLRIEIEKE